MNDIEHDPETIAKGLSEAANVQTRQRVKVLEDLLREARNHPNVTPCDCCQPNCLTWRIDIALAQASETSNG